METVTESLGILREEVALLCGKSKAVPLQAFSDP